MSGRGGRGKKTVLRDKWIISAEEISAEEINKGDLLGLPFILASRLQVLWHGTQREN